MDTRWAGAQKARKIGRVQAPWSGDRAMPRKKDREEPRRFPQGRAALSIKRGLHPRPFGHSEKRTGKKRTAPAQRTVLSGRTDSEEDCVADGIAYAGGRVMGGRICQGPDGAYTRNPYHQFNSGDYNAYD